MSVSAGTIELLEELGMKRDDINEAWESFESGYEFEHAGSPKGGSLAECCEEADPQAIC